jgi:hypothetical protein
VNISQLKLRSEKFDDDDDDDDEDDDDDDDNNNNNNNNSVFVFYNGVPKTRWPITETAQHDDTNDKKNNKAHKNKTLLLLLLLLSWPHDPRSRSADSQLPECWVRIQPGARISVSFEYCVLCR